MTNTPYGDVALEGELDKLARAVEGQRNNTVNDVWFKLVQLVEAGHIDRDIAWQRVYDTARQLGLGDAEIRKTMASAEKGGSGKPRRDVPDPNRPKLTLVHGEGAGGTGGFLQPGATAVAVDVQPSTASSTELDVQPAAFLPDRFWEARDYLDHIRRAAHSRGRSAEAVLGAVLARVAADTPHWFKLPATVGSRCGLTLIVALTGPPGTGKSSSKNIAVELIPAKIIQEECDDVPPGSGEGMVEIMFEYQWEEGDENEKGKFVKRQLRHNAFMFADEGEVLAIQARRTAANTILPMLRSAFTDGTLGQTNATEERKRRVKAGSYAYGIVLGIQPDKTQDLFDDAGGGTPQRFLWIPTDSPVPDPEQRPPQWPGVLDRRKLENRMLTDGVREFQLNDDIRQQIVTNDHHKQQHGCNPLDQHADLIQLKVAAVLALLDGREDIGVEDWQLAEAIMMVSNGTRARVLAELNKQRAESNRKRGLAEAERQDVVDQRRDDTARQRTAQGIMRKLDGANDWVKRNTIRRALQVDLRKLFDPVIEDLVAEGLVEAEEYEYRGVQTARYRGSGKART